MASETSKSQIIIIGAGISGLSAAKHLLESKKQSYNVLVLEAQEYIGGRIHSVPIGAHAYELGAQWIHGAENNPIYKIAAENKLIHVPSQSKHITSDANFIKRYKKNDNNTKKSHEESAKGTEGCCDNSQSSSSSSASEGGEDNGEESDGSGSDAVDESFCLEGGGRVDPTFAQAVLFELDKVGLEADKFAREKVPLDDPQKSYGAFSRERVGAYLAAQCAGDTPKERALRLGLVRWSNLVLNADNGCTSVDELAVNGWGVYEELPGEPHTPFTHPRGYAGVVDVLLRDIPPGVIHLARPVFWVDWSHPSKVKVKVRTPGGGEEELTGDHVITTVSLGCLKAAVSDGSHDTTDLEFHPPLPPAKVSSIRRLGFGTVNKIYLHFDEPHWSLARDGYGFQFVRTMCEEDDLAALLDLPNQWWKFILGFDTVDNHPSLLEGWISGKASEFMETLPEEEVLETSYRVLKDFIGDRYLPRPTKITRTTWNKNPFFRGSYSNIYVNANEEDIYTIGKPLPSPENARLLFSGEATHPRFFSTVHGGYLAGKREAKRILKFSSK